VSTHKEIRNTVISVVRYGLRLPEGIQIVTGEGGLPVFPIMDTATQVSHWLIYLQKQGSGPRPPLMQAAGSEDDIVDLGKGWKLARLSIPDSEIHFDKKVVYLLDQLCDKLLERDPSTEN
jgi:hypothetical protein